MSDLLKRELEILIPSNVYEANHDNLHISVTLMPSMENEIVSHYLTRDELIQSLLATCYLPILHETPIILTNTTTRAESTAIAGSFTNRLPLYNSLTVTVSPIPGEANISPWCNTKSVWNHNAGAAVFGSGPVEDSDVVGFYGSSMELLLEQEGGGETAVAKERLKGKRDAGLWIDEIYQSGHFTYSAFAAMV
ncbi:Patatin-like phospholipase domain-containing protein 4 [Rhizoclosmatium hyalinum]|nr:Patatin-like phospholipase domain-containing protein 4 [Rhizoclosmatium hyalinum]